MKICAALLIVLFIMGTLPVLPASAQMQGRAPVFFSKMQDIPVMPGLRELEDQAFVFDKPQGRIVESLALFDGMPPPRILDFYAQTLPQLGWRLVSPARFVRGEESLEMSFEDQGSETLFKIIIHPNES